MAKQDKQQFKEGKEDAENFKPINLGEETTKESHQIYDLKAEKSHQDKMENEIQNEEVSQIINTEVLINFSSYITSQLI